MSFQIEIDKAIKEQRLYFLGDSLPTDWYAAFRTWMPMAEAGEAKAQYNIGRCFDRGDGVDKDIEKAKYWYLKAAEQNEARSFNNLYIHHSDKNSPYFDIELAERYLQKAVELNEPRALNVLKSREDEKENLRIKNDKLLEDEKRKNFILAGEAIKEAIQLALNENQITRAKQLTDDAISNGYDWASLLKPAFEIEYFAFGVKKHLSSTRYDTFDTTYELTFKVKNNSDTEVACGIEAYYIDYERKKVRNGGSWLKLAPKETKSSCISCQKNGGFFEKFFTINLHPNISNIFYKDTSYKIFEIKIPINKKINVSAPAVKDKNIGCFVLTACYGNENHPVVKDFRSFRDQVLLVTPVGKALVGAYYKYGPAAADYVRNKPHLKMMLRGLFFAIRFLLPKQK